MGLLPAFGSVRTAQQRDGEIGENLALQYLQRQGLSLLQRNFRCKGGEIDLVMQDQSGLVFVEVRKRGSSAFGGAAASVTARKQARLILAAQLFLQRYRTPPACRFDVIAIDGDRLSWITNAIQS
jgi:putative endonuclease